jgi:hypothetical protein
MKTLKFAANLVPLVISGEKTTTWRLFDDKNLQVGDELAFINQATGQEFAAAQIISIREKVLGEIKENDFKGHELFESREKMFDSYRSYYGNNVDENSLVKMIDFNILQLL